MKKVSIVAVALTAVLASTSFAAQAPAKQIKKSSARKVVSKKTLKSKKIVPVAPNALAANADSRSDSISVNSSSATSATMPAGTTTKAAAAVQPAAAKPSPFSIAANFYYYGSSLSEPTRGYMSDFGSGTGVPSDPVTLETHLVFGYKINKNMTFSLNPYFTSTPNHRVYDADTDSYDAMPGKVFDLYFPFARLNFGEFVKRGNFKWNGDLRFYPGLGAASHQLPMYFRTGQNFMLTLSPKLTLAAYNTLRYYRYTGTRYAAKPGTRDWRITASPTIEYQALDSLSASLSYNMDVFHPHNESSNWSPIHWVDNQPYAEIGVGWDITKRVNLNPYVDVYFNNVKPYNTMIGVNLALSIL